ncbi:MAG: hypothetical protein M3P50_12955 [Actinomycetota bacterium]|nr:hypothetical protein [Actinomycetota bacterium]
MFVGLIDTRPGREPEPDPEPRRDWLREIPWRSVAVLLVTAALVVAAASVDGAAGLGLILLAVIVPAVSIERALGSWTGMKEHRQ